MIVIRSLEELATELERAAQREECALARTKIDRERNNARAWAYRDALSLVTIYIEHVSEQDDNQPPRS